MHKKIIYTLTCQLDFYEVYTLLFPEVLMTTNKLYLRETQVYDVHVLYIDFTGKCEELVQRS